MASYLSASRLKIEQAEGIEIEEEGRRGEVLQCGCERERGEERGGA